MDCCFCVKKSLLDPNPHSNLLFRSPRGRRIHVKTSSPPHQRVEQLQQQEEWRQQQQQQEEEEEEQLQQEEEHLQQQVEDHHHHPQQQLQRWWQESWRVIGSRRSVGTWTDVVAGGEDEAYCRAPRWKMLLRKLRAEARKMNCTSQAPGFHYDALSYAKNFDDGCWQQCESHARSLCSMRVSAPCTKPLLHANVLENGPSKEKVIKESASLHGPESIVWRDPSFANQQHSPSIWRRRTATSPPLLDLEPLRSRPLAQRMA